MTIPYARDTYTNPLARVSPPIVGAEVEPERGITVNIVNGKTVFYVRLVTAFNPTGNSAATAVGSERIEINYPAADLQTLLAKLILEAKRQGFLRAGTTTFVDAVSPLP
jgi:hypothetical protein